MNVARPGLLVSVRDATEAAAAYEGGADWIDLKEPLRGPLGPVAPAAARDAIEWIGGRVPISAAAGELIEWQDGPGRALLAVPGVSHLKLGLAKCNARDWTSTWRDVRDEVHSEGKSLVAVIYADAEAASSPSAEEVLTLAPGSSPWMLWDTFDKSQGPITSMFSHDRLIELLASAQAAGHSSVVAGRLTGAIIPTLPLELIDMVAVRGAACRGLRESAVCADLVASLRTLLERNAICRTRTACGATSVLAN